MSYDYVKRRCKKKEENPILEAVIKVQLDKKGKISLVFDDDFKDKDVNFRNPIKEVVDGKNLTILSSKGSICTWVLTDGGWKYKCKLFG